MRQMLSTAVFLLVASGSARAAAAAQAPAAADSQPPKSQAEIGACVRTLLDASAELGALFERTEGLTKYPPPAADADPWEEIGKRMAELTPLLYPSRLPVALEARRTLLQLGSDSVPVVLEELRACDAASYSGMARTSYGLTFLHELAGGGFKREFGVDEASAPATRNAVASWSELWTRTAADRAFWTPTYGLDQLKAPRAVEGTEVPFVDNELVLPPGARVRIGSGEEVLEIASELGFERTYTWKGASRSVLMDPRSQRWSGSLGLYFPGTGNHWEEHEGITRGVVQEGQMHFKTLDEAMVWIREPRKWMETRYRNDGLVVAWGRDPVTLYAEVWQVTIAGKRPTELPGSDDAAITVTRAPR